MTWKKIVIAFVLVDFAALTAYAVAQVGYVGFFEQVVSTTAGVAVAADLVISLGLVLTWMIADARRHGVSPVPFVLLTLAFGSVGPLAYLLRRPEETREATPSLSRATAS